MGSRAKLADVPKVHQIIQDRIRTSIATRFEEYCVMLPGIVDTSPSPSAGGIGTGADTGRTGARTGLGAGLSSNSKLYVSSRGPVNVLVDN